MKGLIGLAAAALLIAAAPAATVDDLAWMAGTWVTETGDGWTEERWTSPRAGVMLGTSRSGSGAALAGFEFIRITADADGTIHYWASPGGKPPVPFRLTELKEGEAVFENPAHDYPTRIVYRREGNRLIATVSGREGSRPLSWTFRPRGTCC